MKTQKDLENAMNELATTFDTNDTTVSKKWYSIEDLAKWSGISTETLKHGEMNLNAIMSKMSVNIKVNTQLGGYHNTKKFYSEDVLKALKEYQIKNSVSNAAKNKEAIVHSNTSYIQQDTFENTINGLLDNPEALLTLVSISSKRIAKLQEENKALEIKNTEMKPKAEYFDNYCSSENLSEIGLLGEKTGIGKKNIFKILKADKVILEKWVDNIKYYEAYFQYEKYFKSIPAPFETIDGKKLNRDKLMLTQEGMIYFTKKYKETA